MDLAAAWVALTSSGIRAPTSSRWRLSSCTNPRRRVGAWRHLSDRLQSDLRVEWLSDEALDTSAIEGEILDRASVRSSIRRHFGLGGADPRRVSPAEAGVAKMMVEVFRTFAAPLDHETLWRWHGTLMRERHWLTVIGGYRQHQEPMQVVSGPDYRRRVHYEAPPSHLMMTEMERFIGWYERTREMSALVRAGVAHFYFECIHPFEDGNGRIGRALVEKALAQSLGEPTLIALSRAIIERQAAYYAALESAGRALDITDWLVWFADTVLAAQSWSERRLIRLIDQTRMFDRLRGRLNPRQEKALLRLFREEPEGFRGGLSAENYRRITRASASTATRDLADLVAKEALRRTGERRHTRYWLNLPSLSTGNT